MLQNWDILIFSPSLHKLLIFIIVQIYIYITLNDGLFLLFEPIIYFLKKENSFIFTLILLLFYIEIKIKFSSFIVTLCNYLTTTITTKVKKVSGCSG